MSAKLISESNKIKEACSRAAYSMTENRYRLSPRQVRQMLQAAKEAQQALEKIKRIADGDFVEDSLDIAIV